MSEINRSFKRKHSMTDNQQSNQHYNQSKAPRQGPSWHNNHGNNQRYNDSGNKNFSRQDRSQGYHQQLYEYFLVLNFETVKFNNDQEIVEIALIKVNSMNCNMDLFHEYVKPVNSLENVMGRPPKMPHNVEALPSFPEVIRKMDNWLSEQYCGANSIFVTWGSYHLGKILPNQCQLSKCEQFSYFNEWIDIKKTCGDFFRDNRMSLNDILHEFQIPRRDSSCKSMAQTIADITQNLTRNGVVLQVNGQNNKRRDRSVQRPNIEPREQFFDYFLVLDFEATCIKDEQIDPQEIIEIPTVVVNAKTFEKEEEFHEYVKPLEHPQLSKFCTELTGIQQATVDKAQPFSNVIEKYCNWIEETFLNQGKKIAFVTCGDWDLKTMIGLQCRLLRMPVPKFFKSWINIKNVFQEALRQNRAPGMMGMLDKLNIKHEGHHHSGIDDCRNIANILIELMRYYGAQPNITFTVNRPDINYDRPVSFDDINMSQRGGQKRDRLLVKKAQIFEYFLVLDFEATCIEGRERIDPQEIIEFPVLKVNANTLKTESEFHEYVRPIAIPKLTPFCKELTGITQEQVDRADDFPTVLKRFNEWMKEQGLLDNRYKFVFVTMGDWDLKTMIALQCQVSDLPIPEYFNAWINLKTLFVSTTKNKSVKELPDMMQHIGLTFEGRLHSGIDDSKNIAKILSTLISDYGVVAQTTFSYNKKKPRPKLESKKEIAKIPTDNMTSSEPAKSEKKEAEKRHTDNVIPFEPPAKSVTKKQTEEKPADNVTPSEPSAKSERKEAENLASATSDKVKTTPEPAQQNNQAPSTKAPTNDQLSETPVKKDDSVLNQSEFNTDLGTESDQQEQEEVDKQSTQSNESPQKASKRKKKNKNKNKGPKPPAFVIGDLDEEATAPFKDKKNSSK